VIALRIRVAAWFSVSLGVTACVKSPERERIDFERMRVQQRYGLYGTSAVFANRQSMQPPPYGTVSRESAQDTGIVGTGMSAGVQVVAPPIAITPDLLVLGEQKFTIYCAVCHGDGGFGGSIVAQNMGAPRPPSLRSAAMLAQRSGYIFAVATHGKGRMPSYAPQLTPEERWAVVAYVRQLQRSAPATPQQRADSLRAIEIRAIDSALAVERKP
jgi:mono/diheme cytochrome c family protein